MPGYEVIDNLERDAVCRVFDKKNSLSRYGKKDFHQVAEFEKQFADKFKCNFAQAVSNGTSGLKVALKALGIKPGDEVITQSHTFIATVEAIIECGAIPVICDIDKSLNMNPESMENRITNKTKVVIPVHMGGVACDISNIVNIAHRHNVKVLEDTCQSIGGTYRNRYLGTIGDIGVFSFDWGKMMTTGEGGMIVTDDNDLYLFCRAFQNHGHMFNPMFALGNDTALCSGFNYKMNELQGAIGLVQLEKLDSVLKSHRRNKKLFLGGISKEWDIDLRNNPSPGGDTGDSITFLLSNRIQVTDFVRRWKEYDFGIKNIPDSLQWHYAKSWGHIFGVDYDFIDTKVSDKIISRAVCIPIFVNMPGLNRMIDCFIDCYEKVLGVEVVYDTCWDECILKAMVGKKDE